MGVRDGSYLLRALAAALQGCSGGPVHSSCHGPGSLSLWRGLLRGRLQSRCLGRKPARGSPARSRPPGSLRGAVALPRSSCQCHWSPVPPPATAPDSVCCPRGPWLQPPGGSSRCSLPAGSPHLPPPAAWGHELTRTRPPRTDQGWPRRVPCIPGCHTPSPPPPRFAPANTSVTKAGPH